MFKRNEKPAKAEQQATGKNHNGDKQKAKRKRSLHYDIPKEYYHADL